MRRLLKILALAGAALISSAWLVRLGMQSIIPLPVSDSMIEFAIGICRVQSQEDTTNLIAALGLLVWTPLMALFWWGLLRLGARRPGEQD